MVLSALYNKPNTILEKQKAYQTDPRHIVLRLPRSRFYVGLFSIGFVAGMGGTLYGITSLIKGKPSSSE